jgi:hypothetical protein
MYMEYFSLGYKIMEEIELSGPTLGGQPDTLVGPTTPQSI